MTEEQKRISEEVIKFIKTNNNNVYKKDLLDNFNIDNTERIFILRNLCEEFDLIRVDDNLYSLTRNGFYFVSFEQFDKDIEFYKNKELIEFEKTKIDLTLNKWLLKTKWFPLGISIIAVLVSIYFGLKDTSKNNELEQRLLNLEQKSELPKNDAKPLKIYPKEAVEKVTAKKADTLK
jgi:hypothetical protein